MSARKNPLYNLPRIRITARLDLEQHGVCPVCEENSTKKQMQIVRVGDTLGYICTDHCVCLPVENDNLAWTTFEC